MTQKARQLGMSATTFRNASGLPDDEQVTTARDMVTLALRLQDDFPKHYPLFATRTFTYKDETFRNHNTLLFQLRGHRRPEDRLYARLRLQPRGLRAARQEACGRRGFRRRQRGVRATPPCARSSTWAGP